MLAWQSHGLERTAVELWSGPGVETKRGKLPDRIRCELGGGPGRRIAVLEIERHQPEHVLVGRVGHKRSLKLLRWDRVAPRPETVIDDLRA